jgi:uncharacterized protein (DUF1778 family)
MTKGSRMRDIAINLRAQAGQRDLIDQAASQLGRNRSDFMLEAACEKAQNVLLDQTFFTLSAEAFASFSALCDAPLQANPALDALLASASPWDAKTALKGSALPIKAVAKIAKRDKRAAAA